MRWKSRLSERNRDEIGDEEEAQLHFFLWLTGTRSAKSAGFDCNQGCRASGTVKTATRSASGSRGVGGGRGGSSSGPDVRIVRINQHVREKENCRRGSFISRQYSCLACISCSFSIALVRVLYESTVTFALHATTYPDDCRDKRMIHCRSCEFACNLSSPQIS